MAKMTEAQRELLRFVEEARVWRTVGGRTRRTSFTHPVSTTRAEIEKARKRGWVVDGPRVGQVTEWWPQVLTDLGRSTLSGRGDTE